MTVFEKINHAVRRNVVGQVKLLQKIGKGANASVYKGFLKHRRVIKIVKRINLFDSSVYAKILWKQAGWIKPLKGIKCVPSKYITKIEGQKRKLISDKYSCITNILGCTTLTNKHDAQILLEGTEFVTEVGVGYCLNMHVNKYLPSPVFCQYVTAWCSKKYGNIAMENAGTSLLDGMEQLDLDDLKSIVYQVLIALSWAQKIVHFKHHDLHTGNIFFKFERVEKEWKTPNNYVIKLPSTIVKACIADFGMSSATDPDTKIRYGRIDFDLMSSSGKGWGEFNSDLVENEGYDSVVMFSHLKEDSEYESHYKWLKECLKQIKKMTSSLKISSIGRPLQKVSMTPEDILRKIVDCEMLKTVHTVHTTTNDMD